MLKQNINKNNIVVNDTSCIMFIDMNSFFASCEQQVNYYLRGRPVAVCVYTGKYGAIISPSIEAKKKGVKTGMRLNDAILVCPELVPLETNPGRYREFHQKIMTVLRKYSDQIIPKSIDEAIIDLIGYDLIYKDKRKLAQQIKNDIKKEVGDWLQCSIGIAPNVFLAKLGTELQKPDGLVVIGKENIDAVLSKINLKDLPGIAGGMEQRLHNIGIFTPIQLKYASAHDLKTKLKSVVGYYWYCRLNFLEVDLSSRDYKTMQAMRQISMQQRKSLQGLTDLFHALCFTLEKRMHKQGVYCRKIYFSSRYDNNYRWNQRIDLDKPLQDAPSIIKHITHRMEQFQKNNGSEAIINQNITSMGVSVSSFVEDEALQIELFEDNIKDHFLRNAVYDIKDKYGNNKIIKAVELSDEKIMKDVIGFGSVKDMYKDSKDGLLEVGFDVE